MSGSRKLMNSLSNGGRFLVAPLVAGAGLWSLIMLVEAIPIARHSLAVQPRLAPGEPYGFSIDSTLIVWIALLPSAWGIFKRQSWAYMLTFALSAETLLLCIFRIARFGFHSRSLVLALASAAVLAWLLLPGVRIQFWPRAAAQ